MDGGSRALVRGTLALVVIPSMALAVSCGKKDGGGDGPGTTPVTLDPTDYTYTLEESTGGLPMWTTPCTHKVRTNERPPEATRSGLHLSAARGEFEPVQIVIGPISGSAAVSIDGFPDLGAAQRVDLARVTFTDGWAEGLVPLSSGDEVDLSGSRPQPVWLTVYVPEDAPAGEHTTTLTVTRSGDEVQVPVALYVFDFAIPREVGYATQLNVGVGGLVPDGGDVDDAKTMLFEHRFTPKSVTWPSGFNWAITWENDRSTDPCGILWDEPDEPDQYSIGWLAERYMQGTGWNEVGFPNCMIFQFVNNSTPRPGSFCGIDRGDHYGSGAYNDEWSEFLSALDGYLVENGYDEKAYYYVQNEPQNDEDHRLAAYLCELTKSAAPHLRIAVSEEPKPEIAEDPDHPCGYDIWIAHVRAWKQDYAWERQRDHGEEVWIYSLDHDPDPYFNPTLVDRQGIHQRIIPWVSWTIRATGWAYYDFGRFFDGTRPGVRAELFREGFEDWEYLLIANGGSSAGPDETVPVDATVRSVASSLTSWTRDADALMALRHELGLYIEGTRADLPVLEVDSGVRPRGEYYINFQDPDGQPAADPLEVDGHTWMKIGWQPWDEEDGYGWYGEYVDNPDIARYAWASADGYDRLQRSLVYDDYGRDNLFEFALENGTYEVTVGVGWPGRAYEDDPHNVTIEGLVVVDDEPTTSDASTIERTVTVDLVDGSLSLEMGGLSELSGAWAYTFLAYLEIVPVD